MDTTDIVMTADELTAYRTPVASRFTARVAPQIESRALAAMAATGATCCHVWAVPGELAASLEPQDCLH